MSFAWKVHLTEYAINAAFWAFFTFVIGFGLSIFTPMQGLYCAMLAGVLAVFIVRFLNRSSDRRREQVSSRSERIKRASAARHDAEMQQTWDDLGMDRPAVFQTKT